MFKNLSIGNSKISVDVSSFDDLYLRKKYLRQWKERKSVWREVIYEIHPGFPVFLNFFQAIVIIKDLNQQHWKHSAE